MTPLISLFSFAVHSVPAPCSCLLADAIQDFNGGVPVQLCAKCAPSVTETGDGGEDGGHCGGGGAAEYDGGLRGGLNKLNQSAASAWLVG